MSFLLNGTVVVGKAVMVVAVPLAGLEPLAVVMVVHGTSFLGLMLHESRRTIITHVE